MNKLIYMFNIFYFIMISLLLILSILPSCLILSVPVYYLLYMLVYMFFLLMYMYMITESLGVLYMFLIIAGGIMVTFLFFMVFFSTMNMMMIYLYSFMALLFLLFFYMIYMMHSGSFMQNWEKLMFLSNSGMEESYISPLAQMLTMWCMLFLLYMMYVVVKISTWMKSAPMRKLKL